jgi:hypothetical protein
LRKKGLICWISVSPAHGIPKTQERTSRKEYDMLKLNIAALFLVFASVAVAAPSPTQAAPPAGRLYLDGEIVRTFVVPSPLPHGGTNPLYMVTNGVEDQLGIATYGPGSPNYSGGAWAVYEVTFNTGVTPYLLTSAAEVQEAEQAGDVTVTRTPDADNRCPVLR